PGAAGQGRGAAGDWREVVLRAAAGLLLDRRRGPSRAGLVRRAVPGLGVPIAAGDVPQGDHRARLERVQRGGAALEVAEQVGDVLASPPLEGEPPAGVARDLLQEVGEVAECRGERLRALLPQAVQE